MFSHTFEFALKQTTAVATRLYKDLNTPISLKCLRLLEKGAWEELINMSVDPSNYESAYSFQLDYQAVSFLKKASGLPTAIDTQKVAFEKFMEAEELCSRTNQRLVKTVGRNARLHGILSAASLKIQKILGKLPEVRDMTLKFGPGATSTCRGSEVNILTKFSSNIECSRDALPLVWETIKANPRWLAAICNLDAEAPFSVHQSLAIAFTNWNELHFVPKNAKTDRCICIEPNSVAPLQLMHGSYIRNRLRLHGLDLTKQADINRHYAYLGSIDGSYATIDLASASDTISYELVKQLLPGDWYERLASLRSEYTKLPNGQFHLNEKFSSMGNGYTFELETLIFYTILLACRDACDDTNRVFAFGDDLIVPTGIVNVVLESLDYAGFKVNSEKSFTEGPFRESCGHDYFNGINVRPFFMKKVNYDHPFEIFGLLNGIRHVSKRFAGGHDNLCDPLLRRTWTVLLRYIPADMRYYGPNGFGDAVIICSRLEAKEQAGEYLLGRRRVKSAVQKPRSFNLGSSRYNTAAKIAGVCYGLRPRVPIRGQTSWSTVWLSIPAWSWYDYNWSLCD